MESKFGKKLRAFREAHKIKIMDLAYDLRITYTALSNLELGYKKPSLDFLFKLSKRFGLDREAEEEFEILAGYIPRDIIDILQDHPEILKELRAK